MKPIGHTVWVIPGGHIPPNSTGGEPEYTSRDEIFMLNTGDKEAGIEITVYHTDREPVGPYPLTIGARRMRCVRFNDLIDPEALYLDVDYSAVIRSDLPIVVQFARLDSDPHNKAISSTMAFPIAD